MLRASGLPASWSDSLFARERLSNLTGRITLISGSTRLVALLGRPVAGSLSPRMQNAAFAARGLDWAYVACEVAPERLEAAIRGLPALGFAGANITAPHKQAAAELCDEADGSSVNTLLFRDRCVSGFNTDRAIVAGIEADRVCVIGAGGAAQYAPPDADVDNRGRVARSSPGGDSYRSACRSCPRPRCDRRRPPPPPAGLRPQSPPAAGAGRGRSARRSPPRPNPRNAPRA